MAISVKKNGSDVATAERFGSHLVAIAAAVIVFCIVSLTFGVDLSPGLF